MTSPHQVRLTSWTRNAGDSHDAAPSVFTVWRDDNDRVWINNGGEYYSRLNLDEQYIRIDAMCWEKSLKDEGINLRKVWSSGPDA